MSRHYLVLPLLFFAAFLPFISGCASTSPTKFYILDTTSSAAPAEEIAKNETGPAIGLGPLRLADYLKRPHIVTRGEGNELYFAQFDRWAEPLTRNIYRVLAENLSNILRTDSVYTYPWERGRRLKYRVAIEILSFEVNSSGEATLVSRWTVYGSAGGANEDGEGGDDGKTELISERSSFREATGGGGFDASVSALNKTIDLFSREIASAINGLEERKVQP